MLKIFAALIISAVGLAVYFFGMPALLAVGGISLGLAISEVLDAVATPRAVAPSVRQNVPRDGRNGNGNG